jgi:proteasome lid subunit RPN8/RPN11
MGDSLVFPRALQEELITHAREGDPDEVCGMLAGRDGRVERVFRVRNIADQVGAESGVFRDRATAAPTPGRRAVHYYMDPLDQLRVYREIDDLDLDVIAYYHSHTRTEARPSPTDVRLAHDPSAVWVLVSLENALQPDVRAWRITMADDTAETGDVTEVPLG